MVLNGLTVNIVSIVYANDGYPPPPVYFIKLRYAEFQIYEIDLIFVTNNDNEFILIAINSIG